MDFCTLYLAGTFFQLNGAPLFSSSLFCDTCRNSVSGYNSPLLVFFFAGTYTTMWHFLLLRMAERASSTSLSWHSVRIEEHATTRLRLALCEPAKGVLLKTLLQ
jgi:hypothetical protein